jgi:hypothetical protein
MAELVFYFGPLFFPLFAKLFAVFAANFDRGVTCVSNPKRHRSIPFNRLSALSRV